MAKIVSVHSFRRSTGKSSITANVSAQFAKKGKRVGVIDTDVNSPGLHFFFQIDREEIDKTLNDYLWGQCAIEEAAYDVSAKLGVEGSIYLIPSSTRAGEIVRALREGYDVSLLNKGFRTLIDKLNLDYLFVDTHSGLNEETLLSIAISDTLLLILRTDQQDFQGTAVTVDLARKLGIPHLYLVVNEAISSYDFDALRKQVEETYNAPVVAIIPLSEVFASQQSSTIFSLRFPDHPFSQHFANIVAVIETPDKV
ncbi:MAG: CDP-3,6-dideoxy-D-glycero-L-glycero-4-hexulose-4-reductase [Anaerolineaceae bacterium 4572_32.2]|nr:MAG: CDP-3,6-dideoxy-D-glycero-L-glycero-4-hexulose-4-reductase [Anaerolineaceae bacterium 4572_32.2]